MTLDDAMRSDAPILLPELREKRLASRTDGGQVENPGPPDQYRCAYYS